MRFALSLAGVAALVFSASFVRADGYCLPAVPATWGASGTSAAASPVLDSPVARARDLLARARLLDETANTDEKSSTEIASRLPTLRNAAKVAREKADHATSADKESLVAHAEELEADVVVSEAEVISRKRAAIDNRQTAAALRARAIHIVREGAADTIAPVSSNCDPPFRFTSDGRKIYRIECFR